MTKDDYAKWMLEDPRVNFAISSGDHAARGIEHLGLQVESSEELSEVYGRLQAADRPVLEEGATTCCYAKSEKSWIADPDGIVWEAFFTLASDRYGESRNGCLYPMRPMIVLRSVMAEGVTAAMSVSIYHNPACDSHAIRWL